MSDFKKLDFFMKEHTPSLKENVPQFRKKQDSYFLKWGLAVAVSAAIVFVMVPSFSSNQEAYAMEEALMWEVTADDLPEEYVDSVSILN